MAIAGNPNKPLQLESEVTTADSIQLLLAQKANLKREQKKLLSLELEVEKLAKESLIATGDDSGLAKLRVLIADWKEKLAINQKAISKTEEFLLLTSVNQRLFTDFGSRRSRTDEKPNNFFKNLLNWIGLC